MQNEMGNKDRLTLLAVIREVIFNMIIEFLDASSHFYMRVCPSVRRSVTSYF